MKLRTNRVRSGFTLIELLVVIAIIAILAAILFPVFAQAREKARQSSCQSNMKQLALGIIQYQQDYDETYPLRYYVGNTPTPKYTGKASADCPTTAAAAGCVYWVQAIQPQLKNKDVFKCPSNTANQYFLGGANATANSTGGQEYGGSTLIPAAGYAINPRLTDTFLVGGGNAATGNQPNPATNASVNAGASSIMLAERKDTSSSSNFNPEAAVGFPSDAAVAKASLPSFQTTIFAGHSGNTNYAYCDGHVKSLKPSSTVGGGVNQWGYFPDANVANGCQSDYSINCTYVGGTTLQALKDATAAN